jgi:hypothetical protein
VPLRFPLTRLGVAVAAGALVISPSATAAETDVNLSASSAARETPTVSIPVRTVTSPVRDGENGTILMRVGKSAPIRVIVDTGFSGLIVFPGAWDRRPAGVRQSETRVSFRPASLGRVRGVRGSAPMTFNGVTTTVDVPFVSATGSNRYIRQWTDQGVYGLLGVGTKGAGLVNPFSALPGVLGLRWSIHFQRTLGDRRGRPGEIVLGADPPLESTMALQMPYLGQNVNGAALWDDHSTAGCWRFGPRPEVCLPTQLDSAFNITRVKGARFRPLPTNNDDNLRTGTLVRWAEPGSAFTGIRYRAGNRASVNLTRVIPRGQGQIIVGNDLYFENVVTYNTVLGKVYISDPSQRN